MSMTEEKRDRHHPMRQRHCGFLGQYWRNQQRGKGRLGLHRVLAYELILTALFTGCFWQSTKIEPPVQTFRFSFVCANGEEMNTVEGYIVKDLVADGKKKVPFRLSPEDSLEIMKVLKEINFNEMQSPYPDGKKPKDSPNSLRVEIGSQSKYIEWKDWLSKYKPYASLHRLLDVLVIVLHNTPEYRALPPRRLFSQ
jgi:hypothetical protein